MSIARSFSEDKHMTPEQQQRIKKALAEALADRQMENGKQRLFWMMSTMFIDSPDMQQEGRHLNGWYDQKTDKIHVGIA
jgi:hypothetical protein